MDSTFVSQEKLEELKEELQYRKTDGRKEIAAKIEQAKELGDLSENFEYHEAKEQQAQNESRIVELGGMIDNAVIVEEKTGGDTIGLGAKCIVDINGEEKTFELVGSEEADPMANKISNESVVGKALMGRKPGEEIEVELPSGKSVYKVVKIL